MLAGEIKPPTSFFNADIFGRRTAARPADTCCLSTHEFVMRVLLCIDSVFREWDTMLRDKRLNSGEEIMVYTAHFSDVSFVSYFDSKPVVSIANFPSQGLHKTVSVDFVLFRSTVHGIAGHDNSVCLQAILHSGIPCMNSGLPRK